MSESPPAFITIIDNAGREKRQRVEYTVIDVQDETVYITTERLQYIRFHLQESGKVKGYQLDVPPKVWYLNPQRRKRTFGL